MKRHTNIHTHTDNHYKLITDTIHFITSHDEVTIKCSNCIQHRCGRRDLTELETDEMTSYRKMQRNS